MAIDLYRLYDNPFGKSVSIGHVGPLKETFRIDYYNYIEKDIRSEIFLGDKKYDEHIFYIKVPSVSNFKYPEKYKIFYDVILVFRSVDLEDKIIENLTEQPNLKNYGVYVYSNSPAFTFSYTNLYKTGNTFVDLQPCLVPWVPVNKYTPESYNKRAVIRNPYGFNNLEKSIWFSLYYIHLYSLLDKPQFNGNIEKTFNKSILLSGIMNQGDKLAQIKEYKKYVLPKPDINRDKTTIPKPDRKASAFDVSYSRENLISYKTKNKK